MRRSRSTTDTIFVFNAIVEYELFGRNWQSRRHINIKQAFGTSSNKSKTAHVQNDRVLDLLENVEELYSDMKNVQNIAIPTLISVVVQLGLNRVKYSNRQFCHVYLWPWDVLCKWIIYKQYNITVILMLFADDMIILGNANSVGDLQNSPNLLHTYSKQWGLEENALKSR